MGGKRQSSRKEREKTDEYYSVRKNLNALKSNRNSDSRDDFDPTSFQDSKSQTQRVNFSDTGGGLNYADYFRIDEKVDTLKDDVYNHRESNSKEREQLRKDLEGKVETTSADLNTKIKELKAEVSEKLESKWFFLSITVLCVIVGIIWILSYQNLIDDTHKNTEFRIQLEATKIEPKGQ